MDGVFYKTAIFLYMPVKRNAIGKVSLRRESGGEKGTI
jgi:hypothetical protein